MNHNPPHKNADKDMAQRFRDEMMMFNLKEYDKGYGKGYDKGFKDSAEPVVRGCFAAVCLALNDLHGFGQKRCMDVLNAVDEHMTMTLTSDEAIDEVWDRMKLKLVFSEAFDRVQEADE